MSVYVVYEVEQEDRGEADATIHAVFTERWRADLAALRLHGQVSEVLLDPESL